MGRKFWLMTKPKNLEQGMDEEFEVLPTGIYSKRKAKEYAKRYGFMWLFKVEEKEAFRNREKADEFGEARDVPIEDIEGDF